MARRPDIAFIILAFIMIPCYSEGRLGSLPPELSVYQDAAKCIEVNKTWYLTYSSVPLTDLPSNVTCIRYAPVTPITNGESLSQLQFDPNGTVYIRSTYHSAQGQGVKNVVYTFHLPNGGSHRFQVLYSECDACKVYGFEYINKEQGCLMYVAESAMEEENSYCHYIFDLFCGSSPKYITSDASCVALHRRKYQA